MKIQDRMDQKQYKNPVNHSELENIERRIPILSFTSAEQFNRDKIDQQWKLLTEAIRREILTDVETRKIACEFAIHPVNELLPNKFLEACSTNSRISRLIKRYRNNIGAYLVLEPVPEDQISPDVIHAQSLITPENVIKHLKEICQPDTSEFYQELMGHINSGIFLRGITGQERLLIIQRYRFARDVKLLVLQAEVLEQGENMQINDNDKIILPSGIVIYFNVDNEKTRQDLINPNLWESRKQLKDRVYEIQVGSSKYILKERKTARHTDTKRHGHKAGLSSLEEFETSQYFQEHAVIEQGNFIVNWEKPLAVVVFPDGYQFTVFEHENGLIEEKSITRLLAEEIQNHRKQFEPEFNVIKEMADKYKNNPKVLAFEKGDTEFGLKTILNWMRLRKEQDPDLTFEEFAKLKSFRMQRQARSLMEEIIIKNGFSNSDIDGYAYKINSKDGNLYLEIFGFDFEYFSRIPQEKIYEQLVRQRESDKHFETSMGLGFLQWSDGTAVTRMQKAGYFALLELEGLMEND